MKTETTPEAIAVFPSKVEAALSGLKTRLQTAYEKKYAGLGEIIRIVLEEEEEAQARQLSIFPHLFLPDLVEAHIARLGIEPADVPDFVFAPASPPELVLAAA
jgi:hypothetical protein